MTEEGKEKDKIKVLLVSNISMSATKDQIFTMFQYVGRIEEMKIYPSEANIQLSTTRKSAFIRFDDERAVEVGQHLSNIVLIDQALNCIPWRQSSIPDEQAFLNSGDVTGLGERQLPPHVTNRVQDAGDGTKALLTIDPTLEQLGLPAYPPLPADTDQAKVEEIRRTVYVGNLPKSIDGQKVLDFFNCYVGEIDEAHHVDEPDDGASEVNDTIKILGQRTRGTPLGKRLPSRRLDLVMYLRMATGSDSLPCAYAYIEFSQQPSVSIALQNNGLEFEGRPLKIVHSRVAIIKPQQKTDAQALEEIEDAIRMGKTGGGGEGNLTTLALFYKVYQKLEHFQRFFPTDQK
ncbi:hypothetical protein WR25_13270 isoform B [Diploscapter pachys]|uniref:RRM domain-containing protein n=1 Tax=Diploscapter pachys TaxID=2018661 RepID=A0A2A2LWM4_9BILA|nr:hypothetical protein WR25_13270 isoform B [Diploscapter pachys]